MTGLSEVSGLGQGTIQVLTAVALMLVVGSLERGLRLTRRPDDAVLRDRLRSTVSWWALFLLFASLLIVGRAALVAGFAAASLLLLRDTLRLAGRSRSFPWAAAAAVGAFAWMWLDRPSLMGRVIPLLALALGAGELAWRAGGKRWSSWGRLRAAALPVGLGISGPLFAAGVALLPPPMVPEPSRQGWLVLLIVLTELNNSAQAWWGRAFGTHQMAPKLSPNKTWEGLVGGALTTTLAAVVAGPLLTPYGRALPLDGAAPGPPWLWSAALGSALAFGGAAGDLIGSWLKRRAGVKDSGRLLPGQGGALDRLDSLTVTAPLFLVITWLLWI